MGTLALRRVKAAPEVLVFVGDIFKAPVDMP